MDTFPDLDPVLHTPARLQLAVLLDAASGELTFTRLQQLTGLTAGNLSTHLRRLEDAAYVAVVKAYEARTPVTRARLTGVGRRQLAAYRTGMGAYLDAERVAGLLREDDG